MAVAQVEINTRPISPARPGSPSQELSPEGGVPVTRPCTPATSEAAGLQFLNNGKAAPACIKVDETPVEHTLPKADREDVSPQPGGQRLVHNGRITAVSRMTEGYNANVGHATGYIAQHRRMPMPSRPPPASRVQPKGRSGPEKWVPTKSRPHWIKEAVKKQSQKTPVRPSPVDPQITLSQLQGRHSPEAPTLHAARSDRRKTLQNRLKTGRPATASSSRPSFQPPAMRVARPQSALQAPRSHSAHGPRCVGCSQGISVAHAQHHRGTAAIKETEPLRDKPEATRLQPEDSQQKMHDPFHRWKVAPHTTPMSRTQPADIFGGLCLTDLAPRARNNTFKGGSVRIRSPMTSWEMSATSSVSTKRLVQRPQSALGSQSSATASVGSWNAQRRPQSAAADSRSRRTKGVERPTSACARSRAPSAADAVRDPGPAVRDRVAKILHGQPASDEIACGWESNEDPSTMFGSIGLPSKSNQVVRM